MKASQALDEWAATPSRLVVRNFVDLTATKRQPPRAESLLLHYDGSSWGSISLRGDLGTIPHAAPGYWSDLSFRTKHLHPRLEAHPLWLCPEQIRTVAKLPGGAEVVAPPLGRLFAQHLQLGVLAIRKGNVIATRLAAILREYNHGLNHWELLG